MKKLKGFLLGVACMCATAPLIGCNEAKEVSGFTLDESQVETVLDYGEQLDLSKLILSVNYEDGSVKQIDRGDAELYIDMGGFNKNLAGNYTISYTYKGYKDSFVVTVNPAKTVNFRIDRTLIPREVEYGQSVNWDLLKAYLVREDGSERLLDKSEYSVDSDSFNSLIKGVHIIQILYGEYEEYVSVNVVADIVDIELDRSNLPEVIDWGGKYDMRDLSVYVKYEDNQKTMVGPLDKVNYVSYDFGTFTNKTEGEHTITVIYDNGEVRFTKTFGVEVRAPKATGFRVDRSLVDEMVRYNTEVDFSLVKVYETYEDGSEVLLNSSDYTINSSSFDKKHSGAYEIKVDCKEYDEKIFYVTVYAEVVGLVADIKDVTTTFDWGVDYSLEGIVLELRLEDGTSQTISYVDPLISVDDGGYDKTVQNSYKITLTYNNNSSISTSYYVSVSAPAETGFVVDVTGMRKRFEINEPLNLSGLAVKATYEDGSTKTLSDIEYVVNDDEFNSSVEGEYTIYVRYSSYTQQGFVVKVQKMLESLSVAEGLTVAYGGEVDLSLVTIVANCINPEKTLYHPANSEWFIVDVSHVDTLVPGDVEVTVKYIYDQTITATFTITVLEPLPESISVDLTSISTTVEVGSEIDFSLVTAKLVYEDSSEDALEASEFTIDYSQYNKDVAGEYIIKVVYNADETIFTTFTVTVEETEV